MIRRAAGDRGLSAIETTARPVLIDAAMFAALEAVSGRIPVRRWEEEATRRAGAARHARAIADRRHRRRRRWLEIRLGLTAGAAGGTVLYDLLHAVHPPI